MTRRKAAWAWAFFLLGCALWSGYRLPRASVESSIFALLPRGDGDADLREAGKALQSELESRFLVLAVHADRAEATRAAEAYAESIRGTAGVRSAICSVPDSGVRGLLDFYAPYRHSLLARDDAMALRRDPGVLLEAARRVLYLPPGISGSLGFDRDPFGTWGRWLAGRSGFGAGLVLRDGHLAAEIGGEQAVAVMGTLAPRGRGMQAREDLDEGFQAAAAASARAVPDARILRSGFVFHELAAAKRAHAEMSGIGTVSAVAMLILLLAAFQGIRPALLGFLPVAVGCLVGTAVLLAAGGGAIHLIVMVFGATIVGVAEDFGMIFIAGLYGKTPWDARAHLREVRRGILLGLLTTVLAYAALLFVPIPGVRQIGIFSIAGLAAAAVTVLIAYDLLGARLKPAGPRSRALAAALARRWPDARGDARARWTLVVLALAAAWGCARLRVDDDVRLLYARDAALHAEQEAIAAVLKPPGSGRYFLVRGKDAAEVLAREEALLDTLAAADASLASALGVSVFVPSPARQARDGALLRAALDGPAGAVARLAEELESPDLAERLRRETREPATPLTVDAWLAAPVSAPFRHLWRGAEASVVLIPSGSGTGPGAGAAPDPERLRELARRAGGHAVLADPIGEASAALATLREQLVWVLGAGFLLVLACVFAVFRGAGWAVAAPAVLGLAAGLGVLGWIGQPVNLFTLLALALILGMGIDYGIFLEESRHDRAAAMVAINVGAATTILAFGMLAFSTTPAIRGFGIVLATGLGTAWLTAPCLAARQYASNNGDSGHAT